jgi:small acid-soluble spore protein H (minor)
MELNRVQEILNSDDTIEVKLLGDPVWIESLDERNKTVKVHLENDPDHSKEVAIAQIHE